MAGRELVKRSHLKIDLCKGLLKRGALVHRNAIEERNTLIKMREESRRNYEELCERFKRKMKEAKENADFCEYKKFKEGLNLLKQPEGKYRDELIYSERAKDAILDSIAYNILENAEALREVERSENIRWFWFYKWKRENKRAKNW